MVATETYEKQPNREYSELVDEKAKNVSEKERKSLRLILISLLEEMIKKKEKENK
jgi:hypothetical protein